MASMATAVCRASSGIFLSPCDSGIKCGVRAEIAPVRRQQVGSGRGCSLATFGRRGPRLSSIRRRAGGEDDKPDSESKFDDTVDEIQKALGRSFGGTLWFTVLLTLLAVFGGGYVYLIINYADFTDIPILNGPQGL